MDNHPISCYHLGHYFQLDGKQLQEQYKEHLSEYGSWDQKSHAHDWMLFTKNTGPAFIPEAAVKRLIYGLSVGFPALEKINSTFCS